MQSNRTKDQFSMKDGKPTDDVLLGVLMVGPKHGYEIRQFLDDCLESKWHIGNSQMYVLLKRLEKKQLVDSFVKVQAKRPAKRIYSLTAKGKETFLKWIEVPVMHVRNIRIELIVKLFFIHHLSLPCGDLVIQNQVGALTGLLEKIRKAQTLEEHPFEALSLQFRQVTIEAYIQWLKTVATPFVAQIQPQPH